MGSFLKIFLLCSELAANPDHVRPGGGRYYSHKKLFLYLSGIRPLLTQETLPLPLRYTATTHTRSSSSTSQVYGHHSHKKLFLYLSGIRPLLTQETLPLPLIQETLPLPLRYTTTTHTKNSSSTSQ